MRFRLTVTAIREYEVIPGDYPDQTLEAMLKTDREAIADDPDIMLDHPDAKWDVRVEQA